MKKKPPLAESLRRNALDPLSALAAIRDQLRQGNRTSFVVPVYDGARRLWRPERVDLSSVAGPGATAVKIRFRVQSAASPVFDGFRLDDVQILTFDPAAQPTPVAVDGGPRPAAVELEPLTVTGTRTPADPLSSPLPTASLDGSSVNARPGVSLAHALADIPGLRALFLAHPTQECILD